MEDSEVFAQSLTRALNADLTLAASYTEAEKLLAEGPNDYLTALVDCMLPDEPYWPTASSIWP